MKKEIGKKKPNTKIFFQSQHKTGMPDYKIGQHLRAKII